MIKKLFSKVLIVIYLLLGLFIIPISINAQENSGLVVSPASKIITLPPQGTGKINFNIINKNEYSISFKLKSGEILNGKTIIDNSNEAFASKWMSFSSTGIITLKPQQSYPVELTVTLPATAPEGIYTLYAVAEISNTPSSISSETSIKEYLPFELTLNVNSKNSFNSDVRIKSLTIDKNPVLDTKYTINLSIANYSTSSLAKPIAYFQIINPRGEVIRQEVINESLAQVLGGETISKSFENSIDLFDYKNLGEFRAEVLVIDTLTQSSTIQKVNFIVIPLPFAIFGIALLILVLLILIRIFRRKKKALK